jgi:RNA polymerase sigma-70 factor (family 1)
MIETEPSLVVLFRQGDERAFEKVYHSYHKIIYTYAMKFTGSAEASEEITHDIFLKLWQFRENIDVSCSFKNLLFTISKNQLLNCQRHEKHISSLACQLPSRPVVSRNAGEDEILAQELQCAFYKAINHLPPQCKQIFNMSRLENKSYDEIAREMHISRNTVRLQIIKSLKLLRERLNIILS